VSVVGDEDNDKEDEDDGAENGAVNDGTGWCCFVEGSVGDVDSCGHPHFCPFMLDGADGDR
jgi:hypothetical protein